MADDMDEVFATIGFGRWQIVYVTAAILGPAALAPALIGSTLINGPVAFRCKQRNSSDRNLSSEESPAPYFDNRCVETDSASLWEPTINSSFPSSENISMKSVLCPEYEFDRSVFTSTIASEWGLVCDEAWMSPLYQIVISAGCMLGDIVGGTIGDKLGRRATVRYGSFVVVATVIVIGLCPLYTVILLCRALLGLALSSIIYPCYNLVMEITPTKQRTIVGMILCAPYSIAVMIFALLGYYIRSWRGLHLASSVFAFLLLPVSWFMDESPRWLVQENRLEEAKNILEKAAYRNRSSFSLENLDHRLQMLYANSQSQTVDKESSLQGLRHYFSKKSMAVITIVTPITWFLMGIVYLGIPLNVGNFGGNPFTYLALTGLMEMLPTIIGVAFSKKFYRVRIMSLTFFLAGTCCTLLSVLENFTDILRWIIVMTAMVMISTNYMMSYVWAPELYPTVVRSRGCCSCALAGHLGFFVTPFVTDVLAKHIWWVPSFVFASSGYIAACLVFLLPETKGLSLCETVQDIEKRWKSQKEMGYAQRSCLSGVKNCYA